MKRLIGVLSLALVIALFLSFSTMAAAKTKITVWAWGEAAMAVEAAKDDFEAKNPDMEIDLVEMGPWDIMDKLLVSMASGKGAPDVSEVVRRLFSTYAVSGGLVDLTDKAMPYKQDMMETAWSQVEFDARVWGAPADVNPGWVVYNKEIFDEYGIAVSSIETWSDMIEVGKVLKNHGIDLLQLHVPAGTWGTNHFTMFLNSRGGNIFDKDGKVTRNNQLAKETLEFYYNLSEYAMLVPQGDPSIWSAFKDGKVATYVHNAGMAAVLKQSAPELAGKMRVMPWPKWSADAPSTTGQWGGAVWVIPKQSPKQEAAWRFIEYMSFSKAGAEYMWTDGLLMSSYKPGLESDVFRQPDPYFGDQITWEALEARSVPTLYQFDWAKTEKIMGDVIDAMFNGHIVPDEAWDEIERTLISELGR
jgi:multiple sugar transport system substrate-binding protein